MMRNALRAGFTLIELLVTLILLGILVAVVFPVLVQQIDDAEPTKAANDLANIRTGMELFHLNIRPTYPGDLEDLTVEINETTDSILGSNTADYQAKDVARWKGPYIDATITTEDPAAPAVVTAFSGAIINDLKLFDVDAGTGGTSEDFAGGVATADADFVAIQIDGLSLAEFEAINDVIDAGETNGTAAGESQSSGKFRYLDPTVSGTNDTAFYLAIPYGG